MLKILKKYFPEILIFLIVAGIFVRNYVPGTYLIGWDSLQTELSPWLAVKRALFSVWEEYQSFGLPTGMAHAADLVRVLFLFLVSLVLKVNLVRYFFHSLMLLIGGLGAYRLFKYLGFKSEKSAFALLGAVFYILNLGTAQMFGVPFEPFSVFFAFLPWETLCFLKYIEDRSSSKSKLIWLIAVNFLATPQAYQQTIFLVYVLFLGFLSIGVLVRLVLRDKDFFITCLKKMIVAFSVIFIVNSFWLFPQFYSLRFLANLTKQAKINQLATNVMTNQNIEKGKIQYLARFENFYYDLKDINDKYLFAEWRNHFENKWIYAFSFVPFSLAIIGLAFGKKRHDLAFIAVFVVMLFVFLSGTVPFSFLGDLLRKISIVGQIFRSPFTKFIFPYVLVSSYFFALGVDTVYFFTLGKLFKGRLSKLMIFFSVFPFFMLIFLLNIPAFKGNYFLPQMKIKIADQYIQLSDFFNGQDKNSRIALLPDYTFWGWFQTTWGYDGSGFIWYGIEQPIVSRTFDVWSRESESYFWEIKGAIESQNSGQFSKILDKYDIDYLIVDYSLKPITSVESGLQYDQISEIIRNNPSITLVKKLTDIDIFKVSHSQTIKDFSTMTSDLTNVGPSYDLTDYDSAYFDSGTYIYDSRKNLDVFYPFLDLMTQTDKFVKDWEIKDEGDFFIITTSLRGLNVGDYDLVENNIPLKAKIFNGDNIVYYELPTEVSLVENKLIVKVKKVPIEDVAVSKVEVINCRNNLTSFGKDQGADGLQVYSTDRAAACFSYGRPFLAHWNGYLVSVDLRNIEGEPLFFYILGSKSHLQSKVETNLTVGTRYFILRSGNYYDDGYTFGFQNISYMGKESRNELKSLSIYLFPYDYLKNIKLIRKGTKLVSMVTTEEPNIRKINYSMYYVEKGSVSDNTLILFQSFDPGWLAICHFNICNATHVKVNNWANAWIFDGAVPNGIFLVYWPQALQFLGFLVIVIMVVFVVFRKNKLTPDIAEPVESTKPPPQFL